MLLISVNEYSEYNNIFLAASIFWSCIYSWIIIPFSYLNSVAKYVGESETCLASSSNVIFEFR